MAKETKIAATDVSLAAAADLSALTIVARVVEISSEGPRRTEDMVHLTLSTRQAMRLLALLHVVQQKYALPAEGDPVTETFVPPGKDRH